MEAWKKEVPNWITYSRMLFVPFIVWLLYKESEMDGYIAAGLFILASLTDALDGYYARKFKVESTLGKFLDPVSDKMLVTSTLIMLMHLQRVGPVLVLLLISRDTLIGGLRSVAAAENIVIAAGHMGKWKTATQMVAIPALLIYQPIWGIPFREIGVWGLWISVVLSTWSGYDYVHDFFVNRAKKS